MKILFFVFFIVFSQMSYSGMTDTFGIPDYATYDEVLGIFQEKGIEKNEGELMINAMPVDDEEIASDIIKNDIISNDYNFLGKLKGVDLKIHCVNYDKSINENKDLSSISVCFIGQDMIAVIPFFPYTKDMYDRLIKIIDKKYELGGKKEGEEVYRLYWFETIAFAKVKYIALDARKSWTGPFMSLSYFNLFNLRDVLDKYEERNEADTSEY